MPALNRDDVIAILGPVDDLVIAEIIGMGATLSELAEARAWAANDEPMMNAGRPLAGGRVVRLIEIIRDVQKDAEELATRSAG
jgi:hypothetical protein